MKSICILNKQAFGSWLLEITDEETNTVRTLAITEKVALALIEAGVNHQG